MPREGIRFTCILELAKSSGEVKLRSTDPGDMPRNKLPAPGRPLRQGQDAGGDQEVL